MLKWTRDNLKIYNRAGSSISAKIRALCYMIYFSETEGEITHLPNAPHPFEMPHKATLPLERLK